MPGRLLGAYLTQLERAAAAPPLPVDRFTLDDRALCMTVAGQLRGDNARAWSNLGARIEAVLVGEWVPFTRKDAELVQRYHLSVIRKPGMQTRSCQLSRLGILLLSAMRGTR